MLEGELHMRLKFISGLFVLAALAALAVIAAPATAGPGDQVVYQTPTAGPDGRVVYKVKEGDTCISISLLNKIDLNELQRLNNLQGDACSFLRPGQELLLAIQAATAGPVATLTPTPILPPDQAFKGNGVICIQLFADTNGNGMKEDSDPPIAGGAVSINDRLGKTSKTGLTVDTVEPLCFEDIPQGEYNISMAAPDGYNATTDMKATLGLRGGDTAILDFGAQLNSAAEPAPVSEGGRSPLLGLLGGALVLVGAVLGIYLRTIRRG